MKPTLALLIALSAFFTHSQRAHAEELVWSCPDGETARTAIISGEVDTWPNFSAGHGMRVQKQYPETALLGQSKYIEGNGTRGAICQYYNHIGTVALMMIIGVKKHNTDETSYWREEFKESFPEQDDPENPTMDVCMKNQKGLAHMSVGCSFLVLKD
jgi:hypothetical protein